MSDVRTYFDAGSCVKCGNRTTRLRWYTKPETMQTLGKPTHALYASCEQCGYRWAVVAQDEMGEQ